MAVKQSSLTCVVFTDTGNRSGNELNWYSELGYCRSCNLWECQGRLKSWEYFRVGNVRELIPDILTDRTIKVSTEYPNVVVIRCCPLECCVLQLDRPLVAVSFDLLHTIFQRCIPQPN